MQPVTTQTVKSLESQLIFTIKPLPKLSELPVTYHTVHVIDDKDGNNIKKHFQCDQCNKIFVNDAQIRRHVLTHTGEKPYCCRACNKRFLRNDYLLPHIRCHKTRRVHKCCVCKKTYHEWIKFIKHCLIHDASEYENIAVQEVNTTQILSSRKKFSLDKQDRPSNDLQKKAKSSTFSSNNLFYQANISCPVYSSNCRPLSTVINLQYNTIPYLSSTYNDQGLPHREIYFSHQPSITLYHQKLQPTSKSALQENLSQPPELIYVPPLEPITLLDNMPDQHYCFSSTDNIVSSVNYGSHEVLCSQHSILQSDDIIQLPHLVPIPPLQPIHT